MKKSFYTVLFVLGVFSLSYAQEFPKLDSSPMDAAIFRESRGADPIVKVVYSRPQKKGREVFGGLVSFGQMWRTGANETTEIKFYRDVKFGGKDVKAGTYALYAIPNKDTWTLVLNAKLDTWGAYQYDESKDVTRTEVDTQKTSSTVEAFAIAFKKVDGGAHMLMGWDDTMVEVPINY